MDESMLKAAAGRVEDEAAFRAGAAEGATAGRGTIEESKQVDKLLSGRKMFREEVCRIVTAQYLDQLDRLRPHFLLDPEIGGVKVADFAEASPLRDPDGGCGIRVHTWFEMPVHVSCHGLQRYGLGHPRPNSGQLSFAAAQGDGPLCLRPVLDQAPTDHRTPTAC